jgi:hypothetical protein
MTYDGEHPAWCARAWSCTGTGHPADMAHDSNAPADESIPLSLHSPVSYGKTWGPTTADVRARQPIPGQAHVLVHLAGSRRIGEVDLEFVEPGKPDRWCLDAEMALTPVEARELAEHLLMVADAIDSGTRVRGACSAPTP